MKLGTLFSDGAVLQRGIRIPVWGMAQGGSFISAELNGRKSYTKANEWGRFLLRLPAMEAGGPYVLTVTDRTTGESVSVQDVMIGEVWLASGQSNMQHTLGDDWTSSFPREGDDVNHVHNAQKEEFSATLKNPSMVRGIHVPMIATGVRQETFAGNWKYLTPENAPAFSAVGAWFIRYIQEKLNVPVGIICSSWGGTRAESWLSRSGFMNLPEILAQVKNTDDTYDRLSSWDGSPQVEFPESDPGNEGFGRGFASCDFEDSHWKDMLVPGSWIQQKIAGNGSVWLRRLVVVPSDWIGKELILHTGGIDKMDVTYCNNVEIGRTGKDFDTDCWDTPRAYTIPAELVKSADLLIAVRAFSFAYDGSLNGDIENYYIECPGCDKRVSIAGNWKAAPEKDFGIIAVPGAGPNPENPHSASNLFDSMIYPLLPYGIRGAVWYQGESNAGSLHDAARYRQTLGAMIKDWRYHWQQGDFPFIQVQLAGYLTPSPYQEQDTWNLVRESQRLVCRDLPNVFMATAIDTGEAVDIHPQDKKSVGFRLAQVALHETYNCADIVPFGPLYQSVQQEGEWIRVNFKNGKDMYFKGGVPKGFYIAGPNEYFLPADDAVIEGSSVRLRVKTIKHPLAVRYSWSRNPDGNLYNGADLPASSFRTDTWSL